MDKKKKISWTDNEIADFKKLIIKRRNILLDEMKIAKDKADEVIQSNTTNKIYSSHMADASSDHTEMERAYYFIAREKKFITYLNRALDMIEDGTFGKCKQCESLISKDRLGEVPHTTKCFKCKSGT